MYLLNLVKPEIAPFDPPTPKTPTVEPNMNMKWIGLPLAEIWPFELFPNESLERSVVGRSSIYTFSYTDLIHCSSLR